MTPKKAIIAVATLFLIVVVVFGFLYFKNRLTGPSGDSLNHLPAGSTNQEKLSPVQQKIKAIETETKAQVEKIVEQGTTATGGVTATAQGKIDAAVNQEIMEKMRLRTPEQIKADEQRLIEQQKIDQETNRQIMQQLKK